MSDEKTVAPVIQWAHDMFIDGEFTDICISEKTFDILADAVKAAPGGRYSAGYKEIGGEFWWLRAPHFSSRIEVCIAEDDSLTFYRGHAAYSEAFADAIPNPLAIARDYWRIKEAGTVGELCEKYGLSKPTILKIAFENEAEAKKSLTEDLNENGGTATTDTPEVTSDENDGATNDADVTSSTTEKTGT